MSISVWVGGDTLLNGYGINSILTGTKKKIYLPTVVSKYSTWLTALRSHPNAELKNDYVKLLVMGLDHPGQVYLFDEYPPAVIEPVEGGDWTAKARNVFFNVQCPRPVTANPPVVTAVSDDRRQFAAYQAVPKTGMQFYYAQSDDPLYLWYFKNNSASVPPADPLHAIPLDWERSLAGIRKTDEDPCDPGYVNQCPVSRIRKSRGRDPQRSRHYYCRVFCCFFLHFFR